MTARAVWVAAADLEAMVAAAHAAAPDETGGVLMGYDAGGAVVVTRVIGAGPAAEHDPARFTPDARFHRAEIASHYERSRRLDTYLGDWHTHPLGGTGLSRTDESTMRRIARSKDARCPRPLMVVVAGGSDSSIAAWLLQRRRGRRSPVAVPIRSYG